MNWQELENGFNSTVTHQTGVIPTDLIPDGQDGWLSSDLCEVYTSCERIWGEKKATDSYRYAIKADITKDAFFRWIVHQIKFTGLGGFRALIQSLGAEEKIIYQADRIRNAKQSAWARI